MSTERRHELEENELASVLGKVNQSIDPYSKPIGVAVAAGLIGLLAWGFYSSTQSDRRSDATLQLIDASISGDSETLATVAAQYSETPAAAWSRLYQGSSKMGAGINALFTSRDEAEELLGEASTAFEESLKLSQDEVIQSRAHFGLARIAESLGNVDEAIESYESAINVGESDAMIAEAKQRIETLSQANTKDFLAWFGDQDFSPADPALPPSLPGAGALPDLPDLDFSDLEDSGAEMAEEAEEPAGNEPDAPDGSKAEPEAAQADSDESPAEELGTEEPKTEEMELKEAETEKPTAEKSDEKAEAPAPSDS